MLLLWLLSTHSHCLVSLKLPRALSSTAQCRQKAVSKRRFYQVADEMLNFFGSFFCCLFSFLQDSEVNLPLYPMHTFLSLMCTFVLTDVFYIYCSQIVGDIWLSGEISQTWVNKSTFKGEFLNASILLFNVSVRFTQMCWNLTELNLTTGVWSMNWPIQERHSTPGTLRPGSTCAGQGTGTFPLSRNDGCTFQTPQPLPRQISQTLCEQCMYLKSAKVVLAVTIVRFCPTQKACVGFRAVGGG